MDMQVKLIFGAAVAVATIGTVAVAQIRPLPNRGVQAPVEPPLARAEPLQIVEAPTGTLFVKAVFGAGLGSSSSPIIVRTTGGTGSVTLRVEASGTGIGSFRLIDPQSGDGPGLAIAAPPRSAVAGRFNPTAAPVTKRLVASAPATRGGPLPTAHPVTIIARDSAGHEVRRTFTAAYTHAFGVPGLAPSTSVRQMQGSATDRTVSAAAAETSPVFRLVTVLYNIVEVRESTPNLGISWREDDPQSEVICIYGTFRYKCDVDSADFPNPTSNSTVFVPRAIRVRVPDIGRGNDVQIVLKGPYGESNPVRATINSRFQLEHRIVRSFNGLVSGTVADRASPASTSLLSASSVRECGKSQIVWDDLTTSGQMFSGGVGASPINLRLAGDATVRVVSVPKGQPITSNTNSWARIEFNLPTGLLQSYTYFLQHSYFTRQGECPDRRR